MSLEAQLRSRTQRMGIALPAEAEVPLIWYMEEMLRWTRRINLTSITDPAEALEKHLLDSLTLLPFVEAGDRLLDIGSGAGLPAIPLKIALPFLQVVAVDAVEKKVAFQRHVARRLGLAGFAPCHGRIEELALRPELAGSFSVVVSRAFAALEEFARLALPFLAPTGRLIAMKGPEGEAELAAARENLSALGLECRNLQRLQLPMSAAGRTLVILARIKG